MCSEPCFQGVLQSLQYLGRELASPQGFDPQDVFFGRLAERPVVLPGWCELQEGGWYKLLPLLPRNIRERQKFPVQCEAVPAASGAEF